MSKFPMPNPPLKRGRPLKAAARTVDAVIASTVDELPVEAQRTLKSLSTPNSAVIRFDKQELINFSSNNYLGLATHPKVLAAACAATHQWGAGSGASRLISGDLGIHGEAERALSAFKGEEAALFFSSGYLANLGAVGSMVTAGDLVLMDRLNHASLIDAARLSGAKLWVYPHRDMKALERLLVRAGSSYRRILVATDAYFSMDGTVAPLDKLYSLCRRYGAILMIDEAHSTGVYGNSGAGLSQQYGLSGKIDVVMGTLSKALGSVGGFVAGSHVLRRHLVNCCRTFIYTTGSSPAASAAAQAAIQLVHEQPSLRKRLWDNISYLRKELGAAGFDLGDSQGPVIPIRVGDARKVLMMKEKLMEEGLFVPAIRRPTVPRGTDRLRISVMTTHTASELERLVRGLRGLRGIL